MIYIIIDMVIYTRILIRIDMMFILIDFLIELPNISLVIIIL